jgi:hypothetical protein
MIRTTWVSKDYAIPFDDLRSAGTIVEGLTEHLFRTESACLVRNP